MTRAVIVTPRAEAQIRAIDAWWRSNRDASPDLFADELARAIAIIELAPGAGRPHAHPEQKGVRRLPLRATRNHIYYVATDESVLVLAVWGAIKGVGPDLRDVKEP